MKKSQQEYTCSYCNATFTNQALRDKDQAQCRLLAPIIPFNGKVSINENLDHYHCTIEEYDFNDPGLKAYNVPMVKKEVSEEARASL